MALIFAVSILCVMPGSTFDRCRFDTCATFIPQWEEPYEEVCAALTRISQRLLDLLPDPSIGPEERLERLARVVPTSVLVSARHLTARTKLNALRARLDELVPIDGLDHCQKLERLVESLDHLVTEEGLTTYQKLERLGDGRLADNGRFTLPESLFKKIQSLYRGQGFAVEKIEMAIAELLEHRARHA
jgi:hypothetical protein